MGFGNPFSRKPGRFVSEEASEANKAGQSQMTPMTMAELRKIGVTEDRQLKLEYFFYTNTSEKAAALAAELEALGYEGDYQVSASNKKQYLITGWTQAMPMDVEIVASWARRMCEIGYRHDCEFDGWGTTPAQ
jgi:regulator of RNase E activity RraB